MSDSLRTDRALAHQPRADLLCPHPTCRAPLGFAPDQRRLVCAHCGWVFRLSDAQYAEVQDALAGITDLHLPAYLLILWVAARPATVEGDLL